ncbi:MAG: hypothetical protein FGM32_08620 [Candidatus Kapabacteria bacterium]|nr:hypothetical protein [Candidatus Kapabacteria bacterium]
MFSNSNRPMPRSSVMSRLLSVCAAVACATGALFGQWREVAVPAPFNQGYYLDVFFLPSNPNFGWACSIEGYIIRTTDAGRTWRGTQIRGGNLEYVQFLSPTVGYASGPSGAYRSTNGGSSWSDITPPLVQDEKMWGSYWLNENEGVFFVGGCLTGRQFFYRTTNAGTDWTVSVTSEPSSGLSDGIIYQNGNGYAVSSGVLWGTNDSGRNWFKINNTGSRTWNEEITVFGRSILIPSSGTDCDGQTRGVGALRFSSDAGRTWSEFQTRANMFGAFLISESTGWGVGDERSVFQTTDFGRTWIRRNCGIRGNIDDVWFVNDSIGWAVGEGIYRSDFSTGNSRITIYPDVRTTSICLGDSLFIEARGPFAPYQWSDGVVAPSRIITQAGTYAVQAYDSLTCQLVRDTLTVTLRSTFEPKITTSSAALCVGDTMTLSVSGPVRQWRWSTGDTTETIRRWSQGSVTCETIDTAGCVKRASFDVVVNPLPNPTISSLTKTTICVGQQVELRPDQDYRAYRWSNGETTKTVITSIAGRYTLQVVDKNGCAGTSNEIEVIVLDTKNKAEFLFSSSAPSYTIEDHEVGSMRCKRIQVRNTADSSDLVLSDVRFAGNVLFSVPKAQFPIIIKPKAVADVEICAAAIDTGLVVDTLLFDDTCSTIGVPVYTTGLPIVHQGVSRCDIPVQTTIVRAGSAWQLRAPYPVPASDRLFLAIGQTGTHRQTVMASIHDVMGTCVACCIALDVGSTLEHQFNIGDLHVGPYVLTLHVNGEQLHSFPFIVNR